MLRIERILCPVDFSESSARAYDSAQSLARHYQAKLFLQHVVDFSLPPYAYYADAVYIDELFQTIRDGARKQLQDFAKSHTRNGVQPECFVHEGGGDGLDPFLCGSAKGGPHRHGDARAQGS